MSIRLTQVWWVREIEIFRRAQNIRKESILTTERTARKVRQPIINTQSCLFIDQ